MTAQSRRTSFFTLTDHQESDGGGVVERIEIPLFQRDYAQGRPSDPVRRIRSDFLDVRGVRTHVMRGGRGRPLLVNFIYTACFEICPNSTLALAKAVNAMRQRFGSSQFNVVSIGFDQPTDSPAALRSYAAQRRISDPNWEFLSPRREDVPALARDFGFSYVATPGGFDHTLQVSIVDAEGRIRRQVVGDTFSADMLGEPLKKLIGGLPVGDTLRLTDIFDRVRILCSVYDPATGEYRVSYALYFEIAGGITFILAMIWFAINEWLLVRAARRLQPP